MIRLKKLVLLLLMPVIMFQMNSCTTSQSIVNADHQKIDPLKLSGGSSGMEKLNDQSYLVVYDIKNFKEGTRVAMIHVTDEAIQVSPIHVSGWGKEGKSSDLESICKIPGTTDEYLIAESGNWKGNLGRIFHIKIGTTQQSARVLGVTKLPFKHINSPGIVGDQYEAILCLPYNETERILILGERGGSEIHPRGTIKWGIYNINTHQLKFNDIGMKGIPVNAPGDWTNKKNKRDITDLHMDVDGGIWAAASEDTGDVGPFYSVIYKLGEVNKLNKEQPLTIYSDFKTWTSIPGFKIEALSGPSKHIQSTLSFGTEDEIYGGVWRAISIQ